MSRENIAYRRQPNDTPGLTAARDDEVLLFFEKGC